MNNVLHGRVGLRRAFRFCKVSATLRYSGHLTMLVAVSFAAYDSVLVEA